MNLLFRALRAFVHFPPAQESGGFEAAYVYGEGGNSSDCGGATGSGGIGYDVRSERDEPKKEYVSTSIAENLTIIKRRFTYPINNDVVIRELIIPGDRRAFIVFIEGMIDTTNVDSNVVRSLLQLPYYCGGELERYEEEISERFIAHSQCLVTDEIDVIIDDINFGGCGVFVDGLKNGFSLDVRKWATRSIGKPENEQSIYGPQEAFGEMLRTNTALIRKIIKSENLIAEAIKIGTVSKTRGVLLSINGTVNECLRAEVKRRIDSIAVEYIMSIEDVSLLLEEHSFILTNQIMSTERPDRAARALSEGRVVLLLNGSPHALIFPTTVFEMFHAVSDDYMRVPYANMSRAIRLIAAFVSILLPGLYLATTLFHHEIIPTFLLYAISAARENVPFPSFVELLLMDISFEMIREAGIRMPSPIGSTLGIVGGLILGQAAVTAKIVSPLTIIVISITGIGSFATADYSLSWTYRILRLVFMIAGSLLGFYGVAMGVVLYSVYLGALKSFGVPFLSPVPKAASRNVTGSVFVNPIWRRERRPGFLFTQKPYAEDKVSRGWKIRRR